MTRNKLTNGCYLYHGQEGWKSGSSYGCLQGFLSGINAFEVMTGPWGSTLEKPNVHACLPEQKAQEDEQDGFCLSDFSNLTWMHLTDSTSFTLECYLQRTLNLINSFYSFTFLSLHSLGPCYIADLPAVNCNIFLEYIHNFYIIQSWLLHYTIICLA